MFFIPFLPLKCRYDEAIADGNDSIWSRSPAMVLEAGQETFASDTGNLLPTTTGLNWIIKSDSRLREAFIFYPKNIKRILWPCNQHPAPRKHYFSHYVQITQIELI